MTTTYRSRSARDAQEMGYGGESYWAYLDEHAEELATKFLADGDADMAAEMYTRTLSDALRGNDGE